MSSRSITGAALIAGTALLCLTHTPAYAQTADYLYWTVVIDGEVWRSEASGDYKEQLVEPTVLRLGLWVDLSNQFLYYGSGNDLMRSSLDGTGATVLIEDAGIVDTIQLDLGASKIYWSADGNLFRADLDGSNATMIVSGVQLGFTLDLDNDLLFYRSGAILRKAQLDGSSPEDVIDTGDINARPLAVHPPTQKIFWVVPGICGSCGVHRAGYDGSGAEHVFTEAHSSIRIYGNQLYSLSGLDQQVYQSNLDGTGRVVLTAGADVRVAFFLDLVSSRIYTIDHFLHVRAFDGTGLEFLVAAAEEPHGIVVDPAGEVFYFSEISKGSVVAVPIETRLSRTPRLWRPHARSFDIRDVRGLEFDGSAVIGTTFDVPDGNIFKASGPATSIELILTMLDRPHDIAIDSNAGRMYWTQQLDDGGNATGSIESADLDGLNRTTLQVGLASQTRGIGIDAVNGKIYWTDQENGEIFRSDLSGANAEAIVTGLTAPHDVVVDPAGGKIYWTDGISGNDVPTGAIRRANLDGTSVEDVHTGLSARIRDITFVTHRDVNLVFTDGFESGDTSQWTVTVGGI